MRKWGLAMCRERPELNVQQLEEGGPFPGSGHLAVRRLSKFTAPLHTPAKTCPAARPQAPPPQSPSRGASSHANMKISYLSVGILSLLTPLTAAWNKEDREIFRIRDEIAAHETNPAATFYDILGILPSASQDDINKAYRKKTRSLHPDKVKQQLKADRAKAGSKKAKSGAVPVAKPPTSAEIRTAVKQASERQARLSLIANILRGPSRERYDHFLAHGFPLWKGTDYYYNRYRPGLGTVILGLFALGGGAIHYLILYMSWKRQKEFVERYVKFARDTAWGNNMGIPGVNVAPVPAPAAPESDDDAPPMPMNRKQRRLQEKESKKEDGRGRAKKSTRKAQSASRDASSGPAPTGVRKRVVAENGKVLVVDSQGDVFLEEPDEEGNVHEFLLDPTFKDTAVVRVPVWFFKKTVGRFVAKGDELAVEDINDDSDTPQHTPTTDSAGEDFEMLDKSTDSLSKVKTTGAQQGGKANKRKGKKR
ncbi:DnaJ domain-containing protein [Purpureocillium lavendulum]|uniref:DnaJ domain-containing protein n=1 Tax=Purpureocillium lavendulum TaxID=1247861 RepID=A0AB34G3H7_9HYPO|nr:DnaJ domain-containing protein [Purpureocillium lavendulum]